MKVAESEITSYLKKEFAPELILLGGSRAVGRERVDSDWDLYLIGEYPEENERAFRNFGGAHLDIALFPKHCLKDWVLRIYYGPLMALRPLLDNAAGEAKLIATATHDAYRQGPGIPTNEETAELVEDGTRILSKIKGYAHDPAAANFHMATFYQLVLPAWFKLRGRWSVPAHEAIPIIREEDPELSSLLDQLHTGTVEERVLASQTIVHELFG